MPALTGLGQQIPDRQACAQACLDTSGCVSFNYPVSDGNYNNGHCWIKHTHQQSTMLGVSCTQTSATGYDFYTLVDRCSGTWANSWIAYDRNLYRYIPDEYTWQGAEDYCQSLGAHLVSIESQEENDFIWYSLLGLSESPGETVIWIGANDLASEGSWYWVADGAYVSYSNWPSGEPNNLNEEDCVQLGYYYSYGQWNDKPCEYYGSMVCEKRSYFYIGCHQDDGARDFCCGPQAYGYTPSSCSDACEGYDYFALQNGGWCTCDDSFSTPSDTYYEIDSSQCACTEDNYCMGGSWANAVYSQQSGLEFLVYEWEGPDTFRGSDIFEIADTESSLQFLGDLTISVHAYPTARTSDWSRLVGKGDSTYRNYGLWINNAGIPLAQAYTNGDSGDASDGSTVIPLNSWTHLAMTIQGNWVSLYVDGVKIASDYRSGVARTDYEPLTLGMASFHVGFVGNLASVHVFSNALSAAEVMGLAMAFSGCPGAYAGYCYSMSTDAVNYTTALAKCEGMGGSLASIRNVGENRFLADLQMEDSWIGFSQSDSGEEAAWYWSDGSPVGFSNWQNGQHMGNGTDERCAMLSNSSNGLWKSVSCATLAPYTCKWWRGYTLVSAYDGSFGDSKYIIQEDYMHWDEAENYCQFQGGHLVTISSKEENDYIWYTLLGMAPEETGSGVWIGAFDAVFEDSWRWVVDGTPPVYTNWGNATDNGSNSEVKDCAHLGIHSTSGYWYYAECDSYMGSVCEIEIEEVVPYPIVRMENTHGSDAAGIVGGVLGAVIFILTCVLILKWKQSKKIQIHCTELQSQINNSKKPATQPPIPEVPGTTTMKGEARWSKQGYRLRWIDSQSHALEMGGRLMTLEEARELLKSGPLYAGQDQWAAVTGAGGAKDWVQIGDKHHHPGKSHCVDCGHYPPWGDQADNQAYGNPTWNYVALWKMPDKPQGASLFTPTGNVSKRSLTDCVVCMDRPKEVLLQPCKHYCVCVTCSNDIDQCPLCQGMIESKLRIYS